MNTPTGDAFAPSAPPTPEPETLSLAENPFDTPTASRTSLNIPAHSALMTESESGPGDFANANAPRARTQGAATLEASSSFGRQKKNQKLPPPPPQPLDLPAPREVPPHTGEHPGPIPPLQPVPPEPEPEPVDPGPPVRWWHEWLCGRSGGRDRVRSRGYISLCRTSCACAGVHASGRTRRMRGSPPRRESRTPAGQRTVWLYGSVVIWEWGCMGVGRRGVGGKVSESRGPKYISYRLYKAGNRVVAPWKVVAACPPTRRPESRRMRTRESRGL